MRKFLFTAACLTAKFTMRNIISPRLIQAWNFDQNRAGPSTLHRGYFHTYKGHFHWKIRKVNGHVSKEAARPRLWQPGGNGSHDLCANPRGGGPGRLAGLMICVVTPAVGVCVHFP